MSRDYNFWVYIVTKCNHSVLYICVTKQTLSPDLATPRGDQRGVRCEVSMQKLIYYEHYRDVRDAIARESQLKTWSRAKKTSLINRLNPHWGDLGADVLQDR